MNLLLDTHTFIWWAEDPTKLSNIALNAIQDKANRLLLSDVSIWEIQIKAQLGKIKIGLPLTQLIADQVKNGFEICGITTDHILGLDSLPFHHKDPFDRLLISQTIVDGLTFVSKDPAIKPYSVQTLW